MNLDVAPLRLRSIFSVSLPVEIFVQTRDEMNLETAPKRHGDSS